MLGGDKRFVKIKGLSDRRLLPRLGKIRLGVKVVSQRTGAEYPKEVAHFVCPPEVEAIYGAQPTLLDIMFPLEDETAVFPQSLKWYVSQGLRCKGNGEIALRRAADLVVMKDGKTMDDARARLSDGQKVEMPDSLVEISCPCPLLESGDCSQKANLMVMLPKVSCGGVYQIDTGSSHNIVRINSAVDYIRALVGRIALVPLVLTRQEEEVQYEGKKARHFLLQLMLNANLDEVAKLREDVRLILTQVERLALPLPTDDGPDAAPGGVTVAEAEATEEPDADRLVREIRKADGLALLKTLWDDITASGALYWKMEEKDRQRLIEAKDERKKALAAEIEAVRNSGHPRNDKPEAPKPEQQKLI